MPKPPPESSLSEQDVRELVALLGGVVAAAGGVDDMRRKLMEGLCRITAAAGWFWCQGESGADFRCLEHGGGLSEKHGWSLKRMQSLFRGLREKEWLTAGRKPVAGQAGSGMKPVMCFESGGVAGAAGPTGSHVMVSLTLVKDGVWSGIGVCRAESAEQFTEREVQIARILLEEVSWLHRSGSPEGDSRIDCLYPRHRAVLALLCKGWSRKRISDQLGISINTVHGYVKAVFRQFGVHSQAELISRLQSDRDSED